MIHSVALVSNFSLEESPHITATKLSERHHDCFLFILWLKLPLLPQMRCPNRDPHENRQFLLTDPQVFTKASDQGWRETGFFNLLRGRLQWYLSLFQLEEAHISCALVAEISGPGGIVVGMFLHIVRDTSFGCEMRNRFWLMGGAEKAAQGLIKHNLEEMGSLAEFLPGLYLRENQGV